MTNVDNKYGIENNIKLLIITASIFVFTKTLFS
jgi:hypothetical protein